MQKGTDQLDGRLHIVELEHGDGRVYVAAWHGNHGDGNADFARLNGAGIGTAERRAFELIRVPAASAASMRVRSKPG